MMDAEELGVKLAWEGEVNTVALDSQGVITRISQLDPTKARSWEGEEPQELSQGENRRLAWVKDHNGTKGSEEADRMVGEVRWVGARMQKLEIATPAGIKHFPIHSKPAHLEWDREVIGGNDS